ncbi:MAG: outer membrane beta-barrel protein [Alphaproteobacteria bacterium]|nr:outer membrane beta-barrel protein [Alphaproteobacteria bacterium]
MKKLLLLAGCLSSFGVSEATNTTDTDKQALAGFYIGLGINYTHTENKIDGYGPYDPSGLPRNGARDYVISRTKTDKFGGTIAAGYGTFFDDFYVGAEVALDINKHRKISSTYVCAPLTPTYNSKIKGVVPCFCVRFGKYTECFNSLFYAKLGMAKISSEFQETGKTSTDFYIPDVRKLSKFTPFVAIGIERRVGAVNLRLEGDYKFSIKNNDKSITHNQYSAKVKNRLSAATVRIVCTYTFR